MTSSALLALSVALAGTTVNAQSRDTLQVQGAQQRNYARIAINLPDDVDYTATHVGQQFTLMIDYDVSINVTQLLTSPLRQATNPRVQHRSGQTLLVLDVPFDANVRDFRSGPYLVVDVYSENASRAQSASNLNRPVIAPQRPVANGAGGSDDTAPGNAQRPGRTVATVGAGTDASGTDGTSVGETPTETVTVPDQTQSGADTTAGSGAQTPPDTSSADAEGRGTTAGLDAAQSPSGTDAPGTNDIPADDSTADDSPPANQQGGASLNGAGTQRGGPAAADPEPALSFDEANALRQTRVPTKNSSAGTTSSAAEGVTDVSIIRDNRPDGPIRVTGASTAADAATVSVADVDDGLELRMPWQEGVAAAAFERGGFLWLVFDQPVGFNPQGLIDADDIARKRLKSVEVMEHPDALVMRMELYPNQSIVAAKDRNDWVISLKDTPAKPRFPLVPQRKSDAARGLQVYIPATDLGRKVEIEDPVVGDMLVVLPTRQEGRGLAQSYSYASSEVLETAQGIVVNPFSDFVTVERFTDGVAIRSGGNDILSASRLDRGSGIGGERAGDFTRLIDFSAWRVGNAWEYRKNKTKLLYELSLQPKDDRNDVRWKLARFYVAHGRGHEALGVLARMLDEDPLLAENTEFLAVRGVSNFKVGRLVNAAADLSARGLEAEQDAELWRTLVAEARGDYEDALEHYRRGKDVMGTYDDYDRAEIQLAVVRSSLQTGNLELAQRELDLLNGLDLTDTQLSEMVYQSARIAEQQGQTDVALAQFDDLADAPQRWIAARARYSRVRFNIRNGDILPEQAIDQLERLRYAWRGDRFEIQLLDELAELYFQTGQYEAGLTALRLGVSHYPDQAEERQMLSRSAAVFRDLFLEGQAEAMTPVSAISLYYKFRDLTPLGADGDLMIRRLAERLVSVDLLERAAELLEYQVRVRTEGAARAQIASNLAKIYILDERPEEALQILRATREPRLPEDIDRARKHVESRALIEMFRYEEAEVVIDGDRSREADYLRADIFWGSKNWSSLASTVRRILGDGWRRNESLSDVERLNLIRLTIALTFSDDRAGLIETRRRYGLQMRQGDFANAFDLLTNDQELSGRELGAIASQIASVEKLQSFMRDYRSDFSGR